jgi:hypothetical protein
MADKVVILFTLLFLGCRTMTPSERIQTEKNPQIFDELVRQLNDLIEIKHERIHPEHKT